MTAIPIQRRTGLLTPGLMPPDDPVHAARLAATVPGMAHYGLTGPEGSTCRECAHWGTNPKYRRREGKLCARICLEYRRLMLGLIGRAVPHTQCSCRHFTANGAAPPIEAPPKVKRAKRTRPGRAKAK